MPRAHDRSATDAPSAGLPEDPRPRVVVVGAGFAGLEVAKTLADRPLDVVVLDRNNYHAFLPLLYQVGAAQVEASDIVHPVRAIFRRKENIRFRMLRVDGLDLERKVVKGDGMAVPYDYLVLALGSSTNYLDVPGAREHALAFKTVHHALAVRTWILNRVERAAAAEGRAERRGLLTFVIVGGGPTGVELAGALAELVQRALSRDFPDLDMDEVRIILVEALDRLLPTFSEKASAYVEKRMRRLGVHVRTGAKVEEVTPTSIRLQDGDEISSDAVVWAAGVRGHPLAEACGLPVTGKGTVPVDPFLRAPDRPEVYVVGDLAHVEADDGPVPMVAQGALQEGRHAAQNIIRTLEGQPLEPFEYRERGSMVAVGRGRAIAEIRGRTVTGRLAWPAWALVHVGKLVGFRNRLGVMLNWAADYIFAQPPLRLILPLVQAAETLPEEEEKDAARPGERAGPPARPRRRDAGRRGRSPRE
jgi:NADH:ubiquinone reductase (H+-translocating)